MIFSFIKDKKGFIASTDSIIALFLLVIAIISLSFLYDIDLNSSSHHMNEGKIAQDTMEILSSPYYGYYNDVSFLNNYNSDNSLSSSDSALDIVAIELKNNDYPENDLSTESKDKLQLFIDDLMKNIVPNKKYRLYELSGDKPLIIATNYKDEFKVESSAIKRRIFNYSFALVVCD